VRPNIKEESSIPDGETHKKSLMGHLQRRTRALTMSENQREPAEKNHTNDEIEVGAQKTNIKTRGGRRRRRFLSGGSRNRKFREASGNK